MPNFYQKVVRPLLFKMPTETAHELGLNALRLGLGAEILREKFSERFACGEFGELRRFGLTFANPFGVAAGFDKNAVVARQLAALGFGFVEVGTLTYHAQPGNEKPRLFRLPQDRALINRAGFNNDGTARVVERLKKARPACVLGVNVGKSKIVPNEEAAEDYLKSFELVYGIADYIAINVSSPNTPALRELQRLTHSNSCSQSCKKEILSYAAPASRRLAGARLALSVPAGKMPPGTAGKTPALQNRYWSKSRLICLRARSRRSRIFVCGWSFRGSSRPTRPSAAKACEPRGRRSKRLEAAA
jgi:hypothetical protein